MGCGQSKIHLYPRKSKSKANGKKGGHGEYAKREYILWGLTFQDPYVVHRKKDDP